jgi:hypothetical protein
LLASGCGRVGYEPSSEEAQRVKSWTGDGSIDPSDGSGGVPATGTGGGVGNGGAPGVDAGPEQAGGLTSAGGTTSADGGTQTGGVPATGGSSAGGAGGLATGGVPATGGSSAGGAAGSGGSGPCVPTNGGVERCDGVDNDCNTVTDDGAVCGSQCTGAVYGGHSYVFCANKLSFTDAAADCVAKSMRLARIDDVTENQFLASIAFANVGTVNTANIWPWFGASDSATPVQWTFVDGTVFWTGTKGGMAVGGLYTNWASAAPGDASGTYCAVLQHNAGSLTWVDRGCANLQPYLCEEY